MKRRSRFTILIEGKKSGQEIAIQFFNLNTVNRSPGTVNVDSGNHVRIERRKASQAVLRYDESGKLLLNVDYEWQAVATLSPASPYIFAHVVEVAIPNSPLTALVFASDKYGNRMTLKSVDLKSRKVNWAQTVWPEMGLVRHWEDADSQWPVVEVIQRRGEVFLYGLIRGGVIMTVCDAKSGEVTFRFSANSDVFLDD